MAGTLTLKIKEHSLLFPFIKSSLIFFYIFDCINKYLIVKEIDLSFSILIRAFYELVFIILIILFLNRKRLNWFLALMSLYCFFLIGQLIFKSNYEEEYDFIFHTTLFVKYTFVFILYFACYKIIYYPEKLYLLVKYLERIFIINSILAIIGFIFNINLFKSYPEVTYRFGYSGLIPALNEATLFYTIGIFYFYYKVFILKIKDGKIIIFSLSCLLLGAKGIYLMIALVIMYHFISTSSRRVMQNSFVIFVVTSLSFIFYLNSEDARTRFDFLFRIAEERGLVTMLLSGRNLHIKNKLFENIDLWNAGNYLFGGQDQLKYLIEMDFFDLFLLMGVVGSFIYILLVFKTVFSFQKTSFTKFFIFSFFLLAALGGHFFPSAVNALYLVIFCLYLKYTCLQDHNPIVIRKGVEDGLPT